MNNKELAEYRAALLWQRYWDNGYRITCAEVAEITGKRVTSVYRTFKVQGVSAPVVWDTKSAIRDRQIIALQAKAAELGRDWLSASESAEATGVSKKNVYAMRRRLVGKNIPEIRYETNRKPVRKAPPPSPEQKQNISETEPRIAGIPYSRVLPGPEPGQVRYLLK